MSKSIAIVGAGPGGLAAAMILASSGYDVQVFEKRDTVGGRNSAIEIEGYTFDMGPTFLSMPHILEEIFQRANRNLHDYMNLVELDTMYELIFPDLTVQMTRNPDKMKEIIEEKFPGNSAGYDRFMNETRKKMDALSPILQNKMDSFMDFFTLKMIKAIPQLSLTKSLYEVLSDYFSDERLKLAFTFQSKYLGMSPWECPGAFSILSFMEHEYGIFHPIGGLNQISKAMARVVEEYGGKVHLNSGVQKLWQNGKQIKGVILEDGTKHAFDDVVINADFAHAMNTLVDPTTIKKYHPTKLDKKKYSISTFMMYLGVNTTFDLPHHTIIFSDDYKENVEQITKDMVIPSNPSIYIQNAVVTDPTLAPEGKSSLYVLAPVPNNFSLVDWEQHKEAFREAILDLLEKKTSIQNIREHIEIEKMITPLDWEQDVHVYKGATFNLGHQLSQMMLFRPHNQFEELENCWLVGGGTHPGSGLPTILESARITTNLLMQKDKSISVSKPKQNAESVGNPL
ncbi:phytoene desaturase family protein [Bacillus sp. DJP31]|uniref:phytoene desaturase family protein n=1 Tax=Bacillus sp. DJP31 TaxID=3409789 RepID=UPI003BB5287D